MTSLLIGLNNGPPSTMSFIASSIGAEPHNADQIHARALLISHKLGIVPEVPSEAGLDIHWCQNRVLWIYMMTIRVHKIPRILGWTRVGPSSPTIINRSKNLTQGGVPLLVQKLGTFISHSTFQSVVACNIRRNSTACKGVYNQSPFTTL